MYLRLSRPGHGDRKSVLVDLAVAVYAPSPLKNEYFFLSLDTGHLTTMFPIQTSSNQARRRVARWGGDRGGV